MTVYERVDLPLSYAELLLSANYSQIVEISEIRTLNVSRANAWEPQERCCVLKLLFNAPLALILANLVNFRKHQQLVNDTLQLKKASLLRKVFSNPPPRSHFVKTFLLLHLSAWLPRHSKASFEV